MAALPEGLRGRLREPMGELVPDAEVCRERVAAAVPDGAVLVTVGDATTERVSGFGLEPFLCIIDGLERREPRPLPRAPGRALAVRCGNPPGGISAGCSDVVRRCLEGASPGGRGTVLVVDGEEDLLAIPACIHAPDGSVVMYGQPGEGLVIVRVDGAARNRAKSLLAAVGRGA